MRLASSHWSAGYSAGHGSNKKNTPITAAHPTSQQCSNNSKTTNTNLHGGEKVEGLLPATVRDATQQLIRAAVWLRLVPRLLFEALGRIPTPCRKHRGEGGGAYSCKTHAHPCCRYTIDLASSVGLYSCFACHSCVTINLASSGEGCSSFACLRW